MRQNLPVTQNEFPFPEGMALVSVTDLKGRILYCNQAFVEVSGFSSDELMGQPHNIVRHPDMPEEAFRDLWATIEGGFPWRGIVKNRRKDGGYYWVLANVTPLRAAGGSITGYLSVRTQPEREQIARAEALYAQMRDQERAGRLRIGLRAGRPVRLDPLGRLWQLARRQAGHLGGTGAAELTAVLASGAAATWLPPAAWVPLGFAIAGLCWGYTHRRREAALKSVVADVVAIAAGDLTHRPGTDADGSLGLLQLGVAQLAVNLRAAVCDVRQQVLALRGAVGEVAAANQDLSSRTEAQASSLQQTAASMEQINGTVRNTATHTAEGSRLAGDMVHVAQRSQQAVRSAVEAMQGIAASSRRIGDIVQVIEDVAFQTNILALNAAVEAARAGESGRGFAVVAGEVRSLAQRTSESAHEIRQLIAEASECVTAGVQQTDAAQAATVQALQAVERVGALLREIDTAAREQQIGVSQVSEAVTHLDTVTQQNAAMVEQMAAAAQSLGGQVDAVDKAMRLFRLRNGDPPITDTGAVDLRRQAKSARQASESGEMLDRAIPAHLEWKVKLRNAIDKGQTLDVDTVSRDDRCPLGQWLHGEGRTRCGHLPAFTELLERHAEFHRQVGAVAQAANAGRAEQARRMLEGGTPFYRATQAVMMAIKALRQALRSRPAATPPPTAGGRASSAAAARQPVTAGGGEEWTVF